MRYDTLKNIRSVLNTLLAEPDFNNIQSSKYRFFPFQETLKTMTNDDEVSINAKLARIIISTST